MVSRQAFTVGLLALLVITGMGLFSCYEYFGNIQFRFRQHNLGYVQDVSDWKTASVDENISLLSVATVYSNISRSTFFVVTENNSVLYAKSHIFAVFHLNASANVQFPVTDKSLKKIEIYYQNLTFLIYIRWISSVRDIPEFQNEPTVLLSEVLGMLWRARAYVFVAALLGVFCGIKIRKWRR